MSLDFAAGSLSAIIGPNGAGKTTLFHLITGMIPPSAGRVFLDGQDITGLDRQAIVRRGIGRAFQVASLFPSFTVAESLAAAILTHEGRTANLFAPSRPGVPRSGRRR
ncbi:ATP-binding cassette domain-containing protein [Pseudoroseomonas wenyumeiae]